MTNNLYLSTFYLANLIELIEKVANSSLLVNFKKMFTGIICEVGEIKEVSEKKGNILLTISAQESLKDKKKGDSIAVDGVCTTIVDLGKNYFSVELMPETLRKTSFSDLKVSSKVNLESPLKLNDNIDGHLVLGHIDSTGEVVKFENEGESSKVLTIRFPLILAKFLALKGSVAVDGVSLTISDLQTDTFSVSLIPHTLENTNLGDLKAGSKVNLEIDMLARYLERMLGDKEKETKYEWLQERGFI